MQFVKSKALPLREAYKFAEQHGLVSEVTAIKDMDIEWERSYDTSVRRGRIIELFESRNLLSQFIDQIWQFGNTASGESLKRRYIRIWHDYKLFEAGELTESDETETEQDTLQFALEAHLRDFLARNLNRIEPGLRLFEREGRKGVEYPVAGGDGRIDILALDRDGKFVVIELKLSRGREKTLGQLLYYMGWVDKNLGNGPCRGAIIAHEITDDLRIAVSRAPGVLIARYSMTFSVERVQ